MALRKPGPGLKSWLRIECIFDASRYNALGSSITGRPFRFSRFLRADTKIAFRLQLANKDRPKQLLWEKGNVVKIIHSLAKGASRRSLSPDTFYTLCHLYHILEDPTRNSNKKSIHVKLSNRIHEALIPLSYGDCLSLK